MSGPADDAAEFQPDALTSETASAWLRRHPTFFRITRKCWILTPPDKRGERIVDMQRFMLDKVQAELADYVGGKNSSQAVEGNAGQPKIHQAVAAIVEAPNIYAEQPDPTKLPALLDLNPRSVHRRDRRADAASHRHRRNRQPAGA